MRALTNNSDRGRARYVRLHSKSFGTALILSVLLGPVGTIYGAPIAGIILVLLTLGTGLAGLLVTWPLGIACAIYGALRSRARAAAHADIVLGAQRQPESPPR